MDKNTPDQSTDDGFAFGETRPDGKWTGFANITRATYQKFTQTAPSLDVTDYEIWILTTGPNSNRVSRYVDVYFKDNDIWVRGFSKNYLPGAWAHGIIEGNYITFDPYIGECDIIGQYLFLYGYENSGKVPLKFRYYAAEKGMTCKSEYIINPNELFYYAVENYEYPTLEFYSAGLNNTEITDEVRSVEWYSLDGFKVVEPSKGIYICKTLYASGKYDFKKIIK